MLIIACLNGSRASDEHPALPTTPEALAEDARRCRDVGAGAVHVHPRDRQGRESLSAPDCAAVVHAIREHAPGLRIGLTTGLWIVRSSERRLAHIERWTLNPDFCSVNFSEDGTDELCQLLLDKGIGVEAGLSSVADARAFVASRFVDRCLRVLIEVEPGGGEPLRAAAVVARVLEGAGIRPPLLQHGQGADAWRLLEDALAHGYDVRIGLEDVLTMPDGFPAPDNPALVRVAARLASTALSSH